MAAAVQNYTISQGATLPSQLTIQLPGQPFTTTGTTAIGSTTINGATTTGVIIGDSISGPGIQPNTVATAVGSNTITLSNPATAAGTVTLTVSAFAAVNLTGVTFLFSAKTAIPPNTATQTQAFSLPDTDTIAQGVVELNWTETTTPLQGQTWLIIPDTTTQQMAVGQWWYLLRVIGAPGLGASSDLMSGIINVTQPASTRIV